MKKIPIFLAVFVLFPWLLSKYKNTSFMFFLRFALLILDLNPEVTTRGLLYKNLFLEILQYSQGNTCVRVLTQTYIISYY